MNQTHHKQIASISRIFTRCISQCRTANWVQLLFTRHSERDHLESVGFFYWVTNHYTSISIWSADLDDVGCDSSRTMSFYSTKQQTRVLGCMCRWGLTG